MLNQLPDLSALAEQLCRIEHKIDLVVGYLAQHDGAFRLDLIADGNHTDPLTQEKVEYYMDLFKRHVVRRSNDGTKLIPPLINLFDPTNTTPRTGNTGNGGENSSNG